MGADRSRTRLSVGLCLAGLLLSLAPSALAGAPRHPTALGSSCAHPITATLRRGEPYVVYQHQHIIETEYRHLIPGVDAIVGWYGWSGLGAEDTDIICSARVQRSDGSWVGPTRLRPYPTPTPVGGEYIETTDASTRYRQVVVKFAKSPVPRGANCDYPQQSRVGGTMQEGLSAAFRVDTPEPEMDEVAVTVHDPNTVICQAVAEEEGQADPGEGSLYEHIRSFPITIGPRGGISSPLPRPTGPTHLLAVKLYTRHLHLPTPPTPKPTHGCSLETSENELAGGETGDTKDFGVKVKFTGTPGQFEIEVAIHNPKVTICSATITVLDSAVVEHNGGESFYKEVSYPVTISPRGGVSRPVTVPAGFDAPKAKVTGRVNK